MACIKPLRNERYLKRFDKQLINCGILRDQRKYWLLEEIPQNTSKNPGGASRRQESVSCTKPLRKIKSKKVWFGD